MSRRLDEEFGGRCRGDCELLMGPGLSLGCCVAKVFARVLAGLGMFCSFHGGAGCIQE